jgi:aminoglycoside phosphotransferase (APT) family kinase protein
MEHVPDFDDGEFSICRIAGGASNLTMVIRQDHKRWVLRRPPLGKYLPTAHDVGREFAFYRALRGSTVPVPRTYALCEDTAVLGAPFYVMEFLDGRMLSSPADALLISLEARATFCTEFARTLARIHQIDFDAVGLGSIAKRSGYLERQLKRWTEQWQLAGDGKSAVLTEVAERLVAARPQQSSTCIVHGDYRIGNIMIESVENANIVAVFDWEMATIGDPLADLGYALIFWGSRYPHLDETSVIPDLPGFLSEESLVAAYEAAGGIHTGNIDYYKIFALFKLAVITQGHSERQLRHTGAVDSTLTRHRDALAEMALDIASRSGMPGLRGN